MSKKQMLETIRVLEPLIGKSLTESILAQEYDGLTLVQMLNEYSDGLNSEVDELAHDASVLRHARELLELKEVSNA